MRSRLLPLLLALVVAAGVAAIVVENCVLRGPQVSVTSVKRAHVIGTVGSVSLPVGTACTLTFGPGKRHRNCRVQIECGGTVLYGARDTAGYADCVVDGGVAMSAYDSYADADPAMTYDEATGRASVRDASWRVDLQID